MSVIPRTPSFVWGLIASGVLATYGAAYADGRPPLPEEAFTACSGKGEGDACTATFGPHSVSGTCETDRETSKLFCRPEGPPPAPPGSGGH